MNSDGVLLKCECNVGQIHLNEPQTGYYDTRWTGRNAQAHLVLLVIRAKVCCPRQFGTGVENTSLQQCAMVQLVFTPWHILQGLCQLSASKIPIYTHTTNACTQYTAVWDFREVCKIYIIQVSQPGCDCILKPLVLSLLSFVKMILWMLSESELN